MAFQGFRGTGEKGIYFSGTGEQMPNFEGNREQRQYWGTGNIRKQVFDLGTRQFISGKQGNRYPLGPPRVLGIKGKGHLYQGNKCQILKENRGSKTIT